MDDNCIIYDWFNCTLPVDGLYFKEFCGDDDGYCITSGYVFIELLGLQDCSFTSSNGISKGGKCFARRLWFEGINIHLPSENQPVCWLEMSGSGCRAFETFGHGNWDLLFKFGLKYGHITRLDVSFDDHSGLLDMPTLFDDTFKFRHFVTKCFKHKIEYELNERSDSEAYTIYHGSEQSEVRIRIYDKAAQLHRFDEHWIRVEMELHRDRASDFLFLDQPIGKAWAGVLLNYLRYVDPVESDSNKWRWPLKHYWSNLVGDAERICLAEHKGIYYNLQNLDNFVFRQAGNAIRTCIELSGVDAFLERLKDERPVDLPSKYKSLLRDVDYGSKNWRSNIELGLQAFRDRLPSYEDN